MHVDLSIVTSEQYFEKSNREVDYESSDINKVHYDQARMINEILGLEASIYMMRRVTGLCGGMTDTIVSLRQKLIDNYESKYEYYECYNEYH